MARDTSAYRDTAGHRLPSVTEILSIAGLVSFGNADPGLVEIARARGEEADTWITLIEKGEIELDEEPPDGIAGYIRAFRAFRRDIDWKTTACQQSFASDRYQFAGTIDLLGELNKRPALLDVKCSAEVSPWVCVQTAGYVAGLESGAAIDEKKPLYRGALHLKPSGSFVLVPFKDHTLDRNRFFAALTVARMRLDWGFAELER